MLTKTNDNDIASKFKVTIRILFAFGRIIALIIRIRLNSKDPYSVQPQYIFKRQVKANKGLTLG